MDAVVVEDGQDQLRQFGDFEYILRLRRETEEIRRVLC